MSACAAEQLAAVQDDGLEGIAAAAGTAVASELRCAGKDEEAVAEASHLHVPGSPVEAAGIAPQTSKESEDHHYAECCYWSRI